MLSIRLYQPRPGSPLQAALGPACDKCRRKKARCNRQQPCQTCARGQKSCSYDAIPKARGRRPRSNSKKESSDSPGSVRSSGTDGLAPRVDASETAVSPVEAPCDEAIMTRPRDPPNMADPTSSATLQHIQLNPTNESETPLQACETDTSSDCTSPLVLQRQSTIESYISEDTGTPSSRYPQLIESEPGLWGSSEGAADLLHPSFCMLPPSVFVPYVRVFVERLYPVFPVIDKDNLLALLELEGHEEQQMPTSLYAFLTALSAAVIVQLNVADMGPPETHNVSFNENDNNTQSSLHLGSNFSAQFFVAQCMQARQQQGFIEDPDEWTILTSFFLFAYHGNLCQSQAAWYFLREAIGFIHALRLDERDTYKSFDAETAQRRRRIFWLLFVTERAYAIQHRRRAVLRPTIDLPRIFESRDPKLAYGFVTLAKVFASVDEDFINAWREQSPVSAGNALQKSSYSADRYLYNNEVEGVLSEIEETQRLDILVTDYWLRVLACQLRMGQLSQSVAEPRESNAYCVLDTSRKLLQIISTANLNSLESHGIGMEQKISDVASCLCDILAGLNANQFSTEFFSAPDFLHNFMVFLASFRNHESQYFQPLAQKATTVLAARLEPSSFPIAPEEQASNQNAHSYEDEPLWTKL